MKPARKPISERRRLQNRSAQRTFRNKRLDSGSSPSEISTSETLHLHPTPDVPSTEWNSQESLLWENRHKDPTAESLNWSPEISALEEQALRLLGSDGGDFSFFMDVPAIRMDACGKGQTLEVHNGPRLPPEATAQGTERNLYSRKTALHLAAERGNNRSLEVLLQVPNVIIDAEDADGNTALHLAANHGQLPAVQILLEHGANTGIHNVFGYTPLHSAAEKDFYLIIQLLVEMGTSTEARIDLVHR
ncbi:uncharacterized protein RCC_03675 [Ramularia collo-cygni]|uniref:BZIP domain-containing protein n=1 Tax=Ramularia collo-cygni TaxID=112498 RepID=A0A2D3V8L7_9PEZI|nr:uncharacterized protein RCC_03675 [Ramularia collo-cygni]CZT17839.1 uncharacterized protein RCC_03675 [Ramularia collo-cygni]